MACLDERPGEQLRLPFQPAIGVLARDRGRFDPPVSGQRREPGVSRVACLSRPQDPESADSKMVVTCAGFAVLLPSGFPRRQPRRSSEDAAIPFVLLCLRSIAPSLTKYASTALPTASFAI